MEKLLALLRQGDLKKQEIIELINKKQNLVQDLTALDLTVNQFLTTPTVLSYFINLEELDLRFNKISSFPLFLSELPNLKILYLGGNKITTIPEEIIKFEKLAHLDLTDLKLSKDCKDQLKVWLPNCNIVFKF